MRKFITLLSLFGLLFCFANASANKAFEFDQQKFENDFQDVNQLEKHVKNNPDMNFNQVQNQNPGLLEGTNIAKSASANALAAAFNFPDDMDWGSFAWGFLCWPIGLFTVVFDESESEASRISYLIGILAAAAVGGPVYFLY